MRRVQLCWQRTKGCSYAGRAGWRVGSGSLASFSSPSLSLWEETEGAEIQAVNMGEIGELSLEFCQEEMC